MAISSPSVVGGIYLGAASLLQVGPAQVGAFVLPAPLSKKPAVGISKKMKSNLAYGLRDDNGEEEQSEVASPSSQFSSSNFQEQLYSDLDPACAIDDEDCLAFSSLDYDQPLVFNSNANEDPLCDPQDVDCQAFLPKTYLNSDTHLAAELATRSGTIENERVSHNWKTAHCPTTFAPVSTQDWVRRVAMDRYPLAVCGGARGGVYVVNLEEKSVLAKHEGAHMVQVEQGNSKRMSSGAAMAKQAMDKLYGKLDGGGVVAVAIRGDLIATSGREGGVRLWRMKRFENLPSVTGNKEEQMNDFFGRNTQSQSRTMGSYSRPVAKGGDESAGEYNDLGGALVPLGFVPGLQNTIVTSLKFDSNDRLWTACYDGTVNVFSMGEYDGSSIQFPPCTHLSSTDFTDSVLDMDLCEELGVGVCATADGSAALFSMDDGQFFCGVVLFEGAARSALIVRHKNGDGHSVMCGGADGIIHRIKLNVNPNTGRVDQNNPFDCTESTQTAIKPRHVGPVMCMESPGDGMFVSGGQDGALRVWDFPDAEAEVNSDFAEGLADAIMGKEVAKEQTGLQKLQTKCLYALTGYKLWLGSVCTDGKRLVSDGGESSIIVRDFSREPETKGRASL